MACTMTADHGIIILWKLYHGSMPLINTRVIYGNPNVTKLSKFKFKGVKAQILHMEGAKGQSCKLKGAKVQSCIWKGAKGQTCKIKSCGWHIKLLL